MANAFDGDDAFLNPYLRYLADHIGLRDWFLIRSHETTVDAGWSKDAAAYCDPTSGRKRATIGFAPDWSTFDDDDLRWICVHELLHCHFAQIRVPLYEIREDIGRLLFQPVWDATTEALEICLDGIAYELAIRLPTPGEWLELETSPESD